MAISPLQQVTFLAAPEFDLGLAIGEPIRSGGVIRNQAGEIVARLEEAGVSPGDAASEAASKAVAAVRDNKGKAITVFQAISNGVLDETVVDEAIALIDAVNSTCAEGAAGFLYRKASSILSSQQ